MSEGGPAGVDVGLIARALHQRTELGAPPFFFGGLDRAGALALARRGGVLRVTSEASSPSAPVMANRGASPSGETEAGRVTAGPDEAPSTAGSGQASATAEPHAAASAVVADVPSVGELDLAELREVVLACTRCRLAGTRTQAVFADGNPDGRVMVVGEAPGANEDRTGLPFVGAAGRLLDLMLAGVALSRRDSVYICNVIKCRPPGNRNPKSDEIHACSGYLRRQIEEVRPEAILAVGTFAGQLLTGRSDSPLGALRGQVHRYEDVPLVVTYHPAALLRNPGWKRPTWEDLQLLRSILDAA